MWLPQSTAAVISFGPFVNPTDGVTLVTSLVSALDHASTGIFLAKNGGTLTIRHATVTASTYDAYGNYKVTLDTTDTNTLGILRVQFAAAASCLPVWQDFMIVPAGIYNGLIAGTNLALTAGVTITQSTTNGAGLSVTGNGTGPGILATSGGGATGDGLKLVAASTNGNGLNLAGVGTGRGLLSTGGLTGQGATFVGGGTSGAGITITTTSGDGFSITPTAGNAIVATANGTSKHGFIVTGGTAGVSDGLKLVAGTGGLAMRGALGIYTKAVAVTAFAFYMSTSAGAPATGLTVTGSISKDGAAFAGIAGAITEISGGWYQVNLSAAEMTADEVAVVFTATGALGTAIKIRTQS